MAERIVKISYCILKNGDNLEISNAHHLNKNYYQRMIAINIPCNFDYTNLFLDFINSKICKMVILLLHPV